MYFICWNWIVMYLTSYLMTTYILYIPEWEKKEISRCYFRDVWHRDQQKKSQKQTKSNPWLLIIKITTEQWDFMELKLWYIYRSVYFVCHSKLVFIFHISVYASIRSHGNNTLLFFLMQIDSPQHLLTFSWHILFDSGHVSCKRMQRSW